MSSRRDFLASSALLGFGATVPTFLGRTARAAAPAGSRGSKDTVLVVVQLTGGNDGLNTVIPFADPLYKKHRPTLGIAKDQVAKINDSLGLHPAMRELAKLHDEGLGCVVQGVGYPNPSQSHFRSMDVWHAASTAETLPAEGWLGRAMAAKTLPGFHLAGGGNDGAPRALAGAPARVPSLTSLTDYQVRVAAASPADRRKQERAMQASAAPAPTPAAPGLLDFVRRTAADTYASSDRLKEVAKGYDSAVPYPDTGLGRRLKLAAQLLSADVGARVIYVSQDGYDTHAGQGGQFGAHANLLGELANAVAAFVRDVKAKGELGRVCVLTFSEFGRRANENGSQGTDHGAAAPMLLYGGGLNGGVVGSAPSLEKLDDGNLKHAIDFRRVYAGVLRDWLGVDPAGVLGREFEAVKLFAKG